MPLLVAATVKGPLWGRRLAAQSAVAEVQGKSHAIHRRSQEVMPRVTVQAQCISVRFRTRQRHKPDILFWFLLLRRQHPASIRLLAPP